MLDMSYKHRLICWIQRGGYRSQPTLRTISAFGRVRVRILTQEINISGFRPLRNDCACGNASRERGARGIGRSRARGGGAGAPEMGR